MYWLYIMWAMLLVEVRCLSMISCIGFNMGCEIKAVKELMKLYDRMPADSHATDLCSLTASQVSHDLSVWSQTTTLAVHTRP